MGQMVEWSAESVEFGAVTCRSNVFIDTTKPMKTEDIKRTFAESQTENFRRKKKLKTSSSLTNLGMKKLFLCVNEMTKVIRTDL